MVNDVRENCTHSTADFPAYTEVATKYFCNLENKNLQDMK